MAPKITIVGGGSTHWTPRLLTDFANTPSLAGAEVALHDVDEPSLAPMLAIGKHIAASRDIGLQVTAGTDLPRALEGADFVISAFTVGGFESMRHDLEIPALHGLRQPVGDSVGPGGIFRSLRSIPVMVSIAREVERRAPGALLLNVSNPMTALCRAVTSQTSVRTVGLCNELVGLQFWLSLVFDVPMHEVDPTVAGVNHLPLVTSLRLGADDGFARLRQVLDEPARLEGRPVWMDPPEQSHWKRIDPSGGWTKADIVYNNRLKLEIFRRFGVLPGSADTHVSEFFSLVRDRSVRLRARLGCAPLRAGGAQVGQGGRRHRGGRAGRRWRGVPVAVGGAGGSVARRAHHRQVTIVAGEHPQRRPGAGSGRRAGGRVHGSRRCRRRACARDVASAGAAAEHLRRVAASQELTVRAALTGDRASVLEAMLADPVAGSLPWEAVVEMTGDLLAATAPWLPQFER